jgi:hypothetical protein
MADGYRDWDGFHASSSERDLHTRLPPLPTTHNKQLDRITGLR